MKLEIVFKDGRKETLDGVKSFNAMEEQNGYNVYEVSNVPAENKLFEVNPIGIDRAIFEGEKKDEKQKKTRHIILEAFAEVDKNPEKYISTFYTMIPKKNWKDSKTVGELETYANDLEGQMADWVHQALEWAQRIYNGESWDSVCNKEDTAKWYRIILWKDGYYNLVGGARGLGDESPATDVKPDNFKITSEVSYIVPLVVFKKA